MPNRPTPKNTSNLYDCTNAIKMLRTVAPVHVGLFTNTASQLNRKLRNTIRTMQRLLKRNVRGCGTNEMDIYT